MTITALEYKGKNLYTVIIDGDALFTVHSEIVLKKQLKTGMIISDQDLIDIKYMSDFRRGRERALYLLEYRDHSAKELFDKLKKNINEDVANDVVSKMQYLSLIDDEKYAKRYAQTLKDKGYGEIRIKNELYKKGIDPQLISDVIDEVVDNDPVNDIVEIINKKFYKSLFDEKGKRRSINALMRLGYSWSDIKAAIKAVCDDLDDDFSYE